MARRKKVVNDYLDDVLTKEEQENLQDDEEMTVAEEEPTTYNTIRLITKISNRVKIPGPVTGKLYTFERSGAGKIQEVDERDVPGLLEKTLGGKRCCGSANKNYVFEIYKE